MLVETDHLGKRLLSDDVREESASDLLSVCAESSTPASKRIKMDGQDIPSVIPTETDVGISQYVSSDLGMIQGIIKQRFSDFQVFEVDPEGKVCHIVDLGPPPPSFAPAEGCPDLRAELEQQKREKEDQSGELSSRRIESERAEREKLRAQREEEAEKCRNPRLEFHWNEEDVDLAKEAELIELAGKRVRDEVKALWQQGINAFVRSAEFAGKEALEEGATTPSEAPKAESSDRDDRNSRGGRGGRRGRGGRDDRNGGRQDGSRSMDNGDPRRVITDPIGAKEVRARLHQVVREMFKGRILTEAVESFSTLPDAASIEGAPAESTGKAAALTTHSSIALRWNPNPDGRDARTGGFGGQSRSALEVALPPYIHFLMQKTNRDAQDAISSLARALKLGGPGGFSQMNRIASKDITIAGTKDKRGVTIQRVSLRRGRKTAEDVYKLVNGIGREADRSSGGRGGRGRGRANGGLRKTLLDAVSMRGERGIRAAHFEYKDRPLYLGNLNGNRFVIVLRNVKVDDEETVHRAVSVLRDQGFINYYGMQRFGTSALSSHHVGLPLIKGDFETAIKLIMNPRDDDNDEARIAKEYYSRGNIKEAFQLMPKWATAERAILGKIIDVERKQGRQTHRNDWQNYFSAIPKTLRTMYIHAYQSYMWNKLASERVKKFGLVGPVVGDIVYEEAAAAGQEWVQDDAGDQGLDPKDLADQANVDGADTNAGESNSNQNAGSTIGRDLASRAAKSGNLPRVKYLTELDLASGSWTIHDVLIPSCGWDVTLPADHWAASFQETLLSADGVTAADVAYTNRPLELALRGTYRKLLHRPKDVSYGFVKYSDTNLPLSQSDEDAILGIEPVPLVFQTIKEADEYEAAQQREAAEGHNPETTHQSFLALKVSFELGTSAYATMALRELTKVDTSAAHQKSLTERSEDQRFRGHAEGNARAAPPVNWLGVTTKRGEKVNKIQGKQRVWGAPKVSSESASERKAALQFSKGTDDPAAKTGTGLSTTVSDAFRWELEALKRGSGPSEQDEDDLNATVNA